jgi:hypothetical protein
MPRLPIIPLREDRAGAPEALPPEDADALQALEAWTVRLDRELAVSQSWLAGVERLAATDEMPDGPPLGFTRSFLEEVDRERATLLKPLPSARRLELEQDLLVLRESFAGRAAEAEASGLALRRRLGLQRALESYRTGVARDPGLYDDAAGRMDRLVTEIALPGDRRDAMRLHIRDALGNAAVGGLMREPERAERLLTAGLFDDALSEQSKSARMGEAQSLVARNQLLNRERSLIDLTIQAEQGTASNDAIDSAAKVGVLTAAEADAFRARNAEAMQAAALREARVQRVVSASEALDPSDPEDRAAVDAYWEQVSEIYASDDPFLQQQRELGLVRRLGVLPDGLRRKYEGALLSVDPAFVVLGAEAIGALAKTDSVLLVGIPSGRVRYAWVIAHYAALDLPPERAIELAERDLERQAVGPPPLPAQEEVAASEAGAEIGTDAAEPTAPETDVDAPTPTSIHLAAAESDGDDIPDGSAQTESTRTKPPSWEEVVDLAKRLEADGEEAFAEAARKAGLDPERTRLFIDILKAVPADRAAIVEHIKGLYGGTGALLLREQVEKLILFGDDTDRKAGLDSRRQDLLFGARDREARGEQAYDLIRGVVGGPRSARGRTGAPDRKPAAPTPARKLSPGQGFKPNRKFITQEEFHKLPGKGVIDPQRIRTSQDKFNERFGAPIIPGVPESIKVDYLAKGLKSKKIDPGVIEPIQLVEWRGHVYTVDHRRLIAFRRAGFEIPFEKVRIEGLSPGKRKRIRGALEQNENGAYIMNKITSEME